MPLSCGFVAGVLVRLHAAAARRSEALGMDLEEQGCSTMEEGASSQKGFRLVEHRSGFAAKKNKLTRKLGFINFLGRESGWFYAFGVLF